MNFCFSHVPPQAESISTPMQPTSPLSSISNDSDVDLSKQIDELLSQFETDKSVLFDETLTLTCNSPSSLEDGSDTITTTRSIPKKKRKSTKRRSGNPAFHPEIRILRRDIRRRYAFMLNNVMNAHDPRLLSQFLQEFAVPHLEVSEKVSENIQVKLCRMKVVRGQEQFVKTIEINILLMPDGIFRLGDVKICQRLNTSGSQILMTLSMVGTMLYEVIQSSSLALKDGGQCQQQGYVEDINSPLKLQVLHQPFEYLMDCIATIHLDCNHRISSMELNVQSTEERTVQF